MNLANSTNPTNSEDIENSAQAITEQLGAAILEGATDRFKQHFMINDIKMQFIEAKFIPIYAQWMAVCMATGGEIRIFFKIQFNLSTFEILYANQKKTNFNDMIKEYCNLMVGYLKKLMSQANIDVGISIPLITRSFDELYKKESEIPTYQWTVNFDQFPDCKVYSILELQVFDTNAIGKIKEMLENINKISSDEGEIQFL